MYLPSQPGHWEQDTGDQGRSTYYVSLFPVKNGNQNSEFSASICSEPYAYLGNPLLFNFHSLVGNVASHSREDTNPKN